MRWENERSEQSNREGGRERRERQSALRSEEESNEKIERELREREQARDPGRARRRAPRRGAGETGRVLWGERGGERSEEEEGAGKEGESSEELSLIHI
eukprot:1304038-Rhodomonas_salina.1